MRSTFSVKRAVFSPMRAAAFAASQLDETFQIEAWGEDSEAMARRQGLAADIAAAARFARLLRGLAAGVAAGEEG